MKKLLSLCLTTIFLFILWGCGKQPTPLERAMSLYQEFLASDHPQESEGAIFYKNEWLRYAFFDMNGDGIPELHLRTLFYYDILTCRNGELCVWKSLNTVAEPLNNGAVLITRTDLDNFSGYTYIEYDFLGNETLRIDFGESSKHFFNDDGWIYASTSYYYFEGEEVSKEEWDTLTEPYFSIGSDKIEWIDVEPSHP